MSSLISAALVCVCVCAGLSSLSSEERGGVAVTESSDNEQVISAASTEQLFSDAAEAEPSLSPALLSREPG